jgi:hypothetical protein
MLHALRAQSGARLAIGVVVVVAVLGWVTVASADVLISNLPGNDLTSTFMNAPPGGSNGGGVHDSKAAGFTMPAGNAYFLDYVDLRLNYFNTSSVPVVQIYSNASGVPGSVLATLDAPPVVVGPGTFRFTPSSSFTLDPSTTYWAVVWNNATVANSFQWFASSPSQVPTGLATNAGYRFSNGPPPPTGTSTTLNSYEVGGTVIPEPVSAATALLGIGAVAFLSRRRRS